MTCITVAVGRRCAGVACVRHKKVIRYLKINNPHGQSTIYAHFPGRSRVFATFAPLASARL